MERKSFLSQARMRRKILWGDRQSRESIEAGHERWSTPMQNANDLGRSFTVLEQNGTLIAVIEMSLSSWLVAGIVPGLDRHPLKKLGAVSGIQVPSSAADAARFRS
jgi:hypothetical protein